MALRSHHVWIERKNSPGDTWQDIRAVGVERLLAVSGVGRASFYRHFASKDDLVVTMLRSLGERWRRWLDERVTAHGGEPLAVFDALAERFESAGFRGCAAINTMVETADPTSAAHHAAAEHKKAVIAYLDTLLAAAGQHDHARLAEHFMLLIDGAIVTALREGSSQPAYQARAIASVLLNPPTNHPSALQSRSINHEPLRPARLHRDRAAGPA